MRAHTGQGARTTPVFHTAQGHPAWPRELWDPPGKPGQQVLHQHDAGGCLQRNKCPSHPENGKPGWLKPRDLHLGSGACPGQHLAKVSSQFAQNRNYPSVGLSSHICKHLRQIKLTPWNSVLSASCPWTSSSGSPTRDPQMGVEHDQWFTGDISPFEVYHALGDARGCVEGRQQFLSQLDGLHSEHLWRKVKGH